MEGWLSSNYGCMEPAPALVYSAEAPLPVRIVTLLWPAEDIHEEPDVEILIDDKGRPSGLRHGVEKVVFDDDEITFQQLS